MATKKLRRQLVQRKHDLTKKRFGKLTVVGISEDVSTTSKRGGRFWKCLCDCGKQKVIDGSNLKYGISTSCGCTSSRNLIGPASITHGETRAGNRSTEYQTWTGVKRRCRDPKMQNYKRYGGRGIKVCDRWVLGTETKSGFECFLEDMGRKPFPEYSIERNNVNGNYEPSNCRWATPYEQARNRRAPVVTMVSI